MTRPGRTKATNLASAYMAFWLALGAAGLKLETSAATDAKVYFGADVEEDEGRLMVKRVYADSPAYEQGLNANDQIVAMDNMRATKKFFDARMAEKKPGDVVNLTIFRFDDLSSLLIRLSDKREMTYRILPVTSATAVQKAIYANWLR